MSGVTTYQAMNEKIVGILECGDKPHEHYAAQRIKELEAEVAGLKEVLLECEFADNSCEEYTPKCPVCGKSSRHVRNCRLNKALSTPTGSKLLAKIQLLEADIAVAQWVKQASELMEESLDCSPNMNIVTDVLRYEDWFTKAKDALYSFRTAKAVFTTHTGKALLAKVEMADQIAEILLDHPDFKFSQMEIDELDDVLSRYRTACNPTKESEATYE